MTTYDTAVLAGFRSMICHSLGETQNALGVKTFVAYRCAQLPESFIVRFELTGGRPPQTIGYLSKSSDATERELFSAETDHSQELELLDEAQSRLALETIRDVLDGKREGGTLRFSRSLSEEDLRTALEPSSNAAPSAHESSVQAFVDHRLEFTLAALDVLSGAVAPYAQDSKERDTFELYAYADDPLSTILIRNFEHDTACVYFVVSSEEGLSNTRFQNILEQFIKNRIDGHGSNPRPQAHKALRPLSLKASCERLGRLLGEEAERGLSSMEPLILGTMTHSIREALADLSVDAESLEDMSPDDPEQAKTLFHFLADALKDPRSEPLWSKAKERADEVRVEVLSHKTHPGSVVLLSFSPHLSNASVVWSLYSPDPESFQNVKADLKQMLNDRHCRQDNASPLKPEHPFLQVEPAAVEALIAQTLVSLANQEGTIYERVEPREFPLVQPAGPKTPALRNTPKTLH